MKNKTVKYGLDVDGVCLNFGQCFIDLCSAKDIKLSIGKVWNFFDDDIRSYDVFKNLSNEFWLNLTREEKSIGLEIVPTAYISHRSCPTEVTRQSLLNAGFPDAPVIHTKYTEDKVKIAKDLQIDVFVDDRASTVAYFLENGVQAYALSQIWNTSFVVPRIHSLSQLKENGVELEKESYRRTA